MKPCRVIGLTGGLGCGKSSVAVILTGMGIPVLDTDEVAREALQPGSTTFDLVVRTFGARFVVQGKLDRRGLADWVFQDQDELRKLNDIVHPVVFREMSRWLDATLADHTCAVVMVPLLFETGAQHRCDRVIVVAAAQELVLERLERRGMSRADALARMRAQMPLEEKISLADVVIWNNGDRLELEKAVNAAWKNLFGKEATK